MTETTGSKDAEIASLNKELSEYIQTNKRTERKSRPSIVVPWELWFKIKLSESQGV